ncbi:MAG TPA: hypothetical protein VNM14_20620 [Planctomycetota bacterium]|jgi:hypothetical protein|nr:hypothetical protein [Planctomycetota bacterium]
MRPLAAKLMGLILLSTIGGCCIRPVGGYYAYEGPGPAVCYEYSSGPYHHGSATHGRAPCPPAGVSVYRTHSAHPAPAAPHSGGHGGNGGSHHPSSSSPGSHSQVPRGGHP